MKLGDRVEIYPNSKRDGDDYYPGNFIRWADEKGELGLIAKVLRGPFEGHNEFEFIFVPLDRILVTK